MVAVAGKCNDEGMTNDINTEAVLWATKLCNSDSNNDKSNYL